MLRGKIAEAVDDFSQAHRLKPEDPSALALRGLSYALLKDKARAVQDFRAVKASNALNAELQKGLAIMGMKADDL